MNKLCKTCENFREDDNGNYCLCDEDVTKDCPIVKKTVSITFDMEQLRAVLPVGNPSTISICKNGTDDEVIDVFLKTTGKAYGLKRGE